jgi:hypothetical protein
MEQDALDTLAKLDVGGGGASVMDSEAGTWRTARWDEGVFDQMNDSEVKGALTAVLPTREADRAGHQRLLPSSDTSSSLASAPESSSTDSTDVVRAKPVQSASALKAAEPFDEELAGSTMTVKGAPTVINSPASDPGPDHAAVGKDGKLPTRHDIEKERAEKSRLAKNTEPKQGEKDKKAEKKEDLPAESQIGTIPSLASSELLRNSPKKAGYSVGGGTHRFTLVDKDAVPLINGKKVSACQL